MVQQLIALAVLAEDSGSFPRIHIVIHKHQNLKFQGIKYPHLASVSTRHIHVRNIHAGVILMHLK